MKAERTCIAAATLAAAGLLVAGVANLVATEHHAAPAATRARDDGALISDLLETYVGHHAGILCGCNLTEVVHFLIDEAPSHDDVWLPARPSPPHIGITGGTYDRTTARRYLRHELARLGACYVARSTPETRGVVQVTFSIGSTGAARVSSAAGFDPEVARCVTRVISESEFPKPAGDAEVSVWFRFDPEATARPPLHIPGEPLYRPTGVYRSTQ